MSTFPGQIDEIPGISVDRFDDVNSESSAYFLSHCHTDHMKGLSVNFFQSLTHSDKYFYCSPITKAFLLGIYPGSPEDRIIEIELAIPKTIKYSVKSEEKVIRAFLTVTTSPAGHCPGSVMFVFTKDEKSVLYTGDFRINPKDLRKLNPLNDKTDGINCAKKFAAVYLDTTFLTTDFPAFPTRKESCEEISRAVKNWLKADDKNFVILECSASYGVEYLLMEVSKLLNTKIHVKDQVYANYMRIAELANCVTGDGTKARIHACTSKMTRANLSCRSDVDPNNILTVVPSAMRWRGKSLQRFSELDLVDRRRLYVCYSMHASYQELKDFVDYFKPDKIVPCVCHDESKNEIHKLLGQLMRYQNKSGAGDEFSLVLPMGGKRKADKTLFKSKYFNDNDDDDC